MAQGLERGDLPPSSLTPTSVFSSALRVDLGITHKENKKTMADDDHHQDQESEPTSPQDPVEDSGDSHQAMVQELLDHHNSLLRSATLFVCCPVPANQTKPIT